MIAYSLDSIFYWLMASKEQKIQIERVYAYVKRAPEATSHVVLVDRLWPRGISKDALQIDEYLPQVGPSHGLRKWFKHEAGKWPAFRERYRKELMADASVYDHVMRLARLSKEKPVILLYGAKNELHNQAMVLMELMQEL